MTTRPSSAQTLAEIRKQNMLMRGLVTQQELDRKSLRGVSTSARSASEASRFQNTVNNLHNKEEARQRMRARWLREREGVGTVHTISDQTTSDGTETFLAEAAKTNPSIFPPSEKIGREALQYTNEYRASKQLPPCKWDPDVYQVCVKHSQQMAQHKKGFNHNGFQDRIRSLPFECYNSGENIYMSTLEDGLAREAVNGWISSPGHERNLRGNYSHCAIGIAQDASSGAYYVTQIFVRK